MIPVPRPLPSLLASSGLHVGLFAALVAWGVMPMVMRGEPRPVQLHEVAVVAAPQLEVMVPPPDEQDLPLEVEAPEEMPVVRELDHEPEPIKDPEFAPVDLDASPLDGLLVILPGVPAQEPQSEQPEETAQDSTQPDPPPIPEAVKPTGADVPDQPPLPLAAHCQSPIYPSRAVQRGWVGTVVARLNVSTTGEVLSVVLEESSGHDLLDKVALASLATWRFQPGVRSGVVEEMEVIKRIEFRL